MKKAMIFLMVFVSLSFGSECSKIRDIYIKSIDGVTSYIVYGNEEFSASLDDFDKAIYTLEVLMDKNNCITTPTLYMKKKKIPEIRRQLGIKDLENMSTELLNMADQYNKEAQEVFKGY